MADMICIALSAKNLHVPKYLDSVEVSREKKYFINNAFTKGRSDDLTDTAEAIPKRCYS